MPAGVWLGLDSDPTQPPDFPRGPTSPPRPPPTSCRRSPCEALPTSRHARAVGAGGERFGWSGLRSALTMTQPRQLTFLAGRTHHPDHRRPRAVAHRVKLDQPHAMPEWSGLAASGRGGRGRKVTPPSGLTSSRVVHLAQTPAELTTLTNLADPERVGHAGWSLARPRLRPDPAT
jgi:hypothetical protein